MKLWQKASLGGCELSLSHCDQDQGYITLVNGVLKHQVWLKRNYSRKHFFEDLNPHYDLTQKTAMHCLHDTLSNSHFIPPINFICKRFGSEIQDRTNRLIDTVTACWMEVSTGNSKSMTNSTNICADISMNSQKRWPVSSAWEHPSARMAPTQQKSVLGLPQQWSD